MYPMKRPTDDWPGLQARFVKFLTAVHIDKHTPSENISWADKS